MATPRTVRGTHDLWGEDMLRHRHVGETAWDVGRLYGYEPIETPIFEFTEVFSRSLGDTSDVVTKEMYTFEDRGGDRLTLRPENTAGVCRAAITGGMTQNLPLKLSYWGPMFRYERPQKGRLRQFHQIGVECIGAAEPAADIEVVAVGAHILERLGILGNTVLELNTLGDQESRQRYRAELVRYLQGHKDSLSADSLVRLERNPMRILDSKDEGDRAIVAAAPILEEHLNAASRDFFDAVKEGLTRTGIAFRLAPCLVRGLDYYCHTAFEFVTTRLGAQGTVMAGGRYDGLVGLLGGPDIPGVGWAAGVERLAMLLTDLPAEQPPVAIVPIGAAAEHEAAVLARELRQGGIAVELAYKGKPGQRLKRADKLQARVAILLGDEELALNVLKLRDLASGTERPVPRAEIVAHLKGPFMTVS